MPIQSVTIDGQPLDLANKVVAISIDGIDQNAQARDFEVVVADAPPPPLAAPSDLTAVATSPTTIELTWVNNDPRVAFFWVERSVDGVAFLPIGVSPTPSLEDAALVADTLYYYRVAADAGPASSLQPSAWSEMASATTPPLPLPTRTLYVSEFGNDLNDGSQAAPFRTTQAAANIVVPGDTILVDGEYAGFVVTRSGEENNRIVFRGLPGARITSPSPIDTLGHGISVRDANYVTIEGFDVRGFRPAVGEEPAKPLFAGISAYRCEGLIIRNNRSWHNEYWGIFTSFCKGELIEGNHVSFALVQHGIYCSNSGDEKIVRDNVVTDCYDHGIQFNGDITSTNGADPDGIISNSMIDGNVILRCSAGINLDGVQNSTIQNNVIRCNKGVMLFRQDGGGPSSGNVLVSNDIETIAFGRFAERGVALKIVDGAVNTGLYSNDIEGLIFTNEDSLAGFVGENNSYRTLLPHIVTIRSPDHVQNWDETLQQWRTRTGQEANSVWVQG